MRGQAQRKIFHTFLWALATFLLAGSIHAADRAACVTDLQGRKLQPLLLEERDTRKATLLIFTTIDCPIANSYAPEISRIHKEYDEQGVRVFLVQVDPDVSAANAKKHAEEYKLGMQVVLDPNHELAAYAGATITPEAALFDREGMLLYRGRIDNRFEGYGKDRVEATVRDLRLALEALMHGEKIANPRSKAVGCRIGDLKIADKPLNEVSKEKKP
jgi:peroxiredoxin